MRLRLLLSSAFALVAASAAFAGTPPHHHRPRRRAQPFVATAYCKDGETPSGVMTHPGIVAADPKVLPTGSVVVVYGLGSRARTFTVEDHGVTGRHLDLFMHSCRAAKRFGRRRVHVRVVRFGDGQRVRHDGRATRDMP